MSLRTDDIPVCGMSIDRDLNTRREHFQLGTTLGLRGLAYLSWDGRPPNSVGSEH